MEQRALNCCVRVASVRVQTMVACICRSACAVASRRRLPPYLESPPVRDRPKRLLIYQGQHLLALLLQVDLTNPTDWPRFTDGKRRGGGGGEGDRQKYFGTQTPPACRLHHPLAAADLQSSLGNRKMAKVSRGEGAGRQTWRRGGRHELDPNTDEIHGRGQSLLIWRKAEANFSLTKNLNKYTY